MLFGAPECSGRDPFEQGLEKGLRKGSVGLNFEGPFWSSFGTLGTPWEHFGAPRPQKDGFAGDSFLGHIFVSNPGTLKCAQERSRCSLSSIFAVSVSLEKGQKWGQQLSILRSEIVTILL